jgi:hypothetical protein
MTEAAGREEVQGMNSNWPMVRLGQVLRHRSEFIEIDDTQRCFVEYLGG